MAATKKFSYSGDPSSSSLDAVRFLIGDTTQEIALFDDREILYQISQIPNLKLAGAELLEVKAREFARQADISVGDISKSLSSVSENLFKAADKLKNDAGKSALPFFGGLSQSGKTALAASTDDVQPSFYRNMMDNPQAPQFDELDDDSDLFNGQD